MKRGIIRLLLKNGSACLLAAAPCLASPKDELVGLWRFKRGVGGPCASQILALEYSFHKDGSYRTKSRMTSGGTFEFSGTYKATDTEATAFVDGRTIGPFPYRIEDDVLKIKQPEFNCEVQLEREDY